MRTVQQDLQDPQAPLSSDPAPPSAPTSGRRMRTIEVAVVILMLSPFALSFTPAATAGRVGFELTAAVTILRDAGLVALVAFLVWRNGEPLADLGWRWRHPLREIAIGAVVFPVGFVMVQWLDVTLQRLGVPGPARPVTFLHPPATPVALVLATVLTVVVALVEETVFRGYLMLRFGQITGSIAVAILASSAAFAMGHGYEGLSGAISVGVLGALFAVVYRWRGSLLAPMTAHFLQDFTLLVVLAALHR